MESQRNDAGKFLSCSVTDGEGKKHGIFIPESRGLIKGWVLLADKLRELGIKGLKEEGVNKESFSLEVEKAVIGERNGSSLLGRTFAEATKEGSCQSPNMIWLEAGECLPREAMVTLKFCLVRSWENPLILTQQPGNWKFGLEQPRG